jgi:hypothetical protein
MENGKRPIVPMLDANYWSDGLTKREYFAALAMQAIKFNDYQEAYGNKWAVEVAKDAVIMADALLEELGEE